MEETESKICSNCKREIPVVNYTIHTVHCARNIKVCPVCKEPVPQAELDDHHEKFHKLLPCKQCGESVCGTDLEDHIRDSCANTVKACRFCELELPRRDLPPHEGYCGVRTEQCPDCREWVMIKYRQLHLESNHGFIRLDDDPTPIPKKDPPKNQIKPLTAKNVNIPSTSNGPIRTADSGINWNRPKTEIRYLNQTASAANTNIASTSSATTASGETSNAWRALGNGVKPPLKRTNDQPQINTNVAAVNKVNKDMALSRGAVKKRPAPQPPAPYPLRDQPFYSALSRQQREERERREQTACNLAAGLPPVLSAAAKVEKLRKMDALQNREIATDDYKNCLQGRVWNTPQYDPPGNVLGSSSNSSNNPRNLINTYNPQNMPHNVTNTNGQIKNPRGLININTNNLQNLPQNVVNPNGQIKNKDSSQENMNLGTRKPLRNIDLEELQSASNTQNVNRLPNPSQNSNNYLNDYHNSSSQSTNELSDNTSRNASGPVRNSAQIINGNSSLIANVRGISTSSEEDIETRRQEFKDLKPMTPQEFMERFNDLQLGRDRRQDRGVDRFSEIKSSLRELRRDLNEVTAPYNSTNNVATRMSPNASPPPPDEDVILPCEFCGVPVPADDLVQHQTGCRPDLAQYRPSSPRPAPPSPRESGLLSFATGLVPEDPLIPCEFCTESLPVYLITEHQVRCGRDSHLLYPD